MNAGSQPKDYSYLPTSDINVPVGVAIRQLELPDSGVRMDESVLGRIPDISAKIATGRATVQIRATYETEFTLGDAPAAESRTYTLETGSPVQMDEWLGLGVRVSELLPSAALRLELRYCDGDGAAPRTLCSGRMPLFSKRLLLKGGARSVVLGPGDTAAAGLRTLDKALRRLGRGADDGGSAWLDALALAQVARQRATARAASAAVIVHVELPRFNFSVVWQEREAELPAACVRAPTAALVRVTDCEVHLENLIETKHRRLTRGRRNAPFDRELKPNARMRDELQRILRFPPTQALTADEKDAVWKFRYYLTREKRAVTKFLRVVEWSDAQEVAQAVELLALWGPIDVEDALELVGPEFGAHAAVHAYGVSQLARATDDELELFLLQLVQALKFAAEPASPLAALLIRRAVANPALGHQLHWYIEAERSDAAAGDAQSLFEAVAARLRAAAAATARGRAFQASLVRQARFLRALERLAGDMQQARLPRAQRTSLLRQRLADPQLQLAELSAPVPHPLDPNRSVVGLEPDTAHVFKSALLPMRLTLKMQPLDHHAGATSSVIFKLGDDLRQDQFVIQLVRLMDRLLRRDSVDLHLTPYHVLATDAQCGLIEYVAALPLATILATHAGSLQNYLRRHHPDAAGPFGISAPVMESYARSCAGYCVVTYLLGVGDRHLDNLLLTSSGRLLHVDFGYILGRDPKPFAPPMKLCKEMVEAMGGQQSPHYARFKSYCFSAFGILRKNANLILNLVHCMVRSRLPDIALAPDQAVFKVQERFRLDLSDEEAILFFSQLIHDSVSALFPQVMERIHSWAQYWRQ